MTQDNERCLVLLLAFAVCLAMAGGGYWMGYAEGLSRFTPPQQEAKP